MPTFLNWKYASSNVSWGNSTNTRTCTSWIWIPINFLPGNIGNTGQFQDPQTQKQNAGANFLKCGDKRGMGKPSSSPQKPLTETQRSWVFAAPKTRYWNLSQLCLGFLWLLWMGKEMSGYSARQISHLLPESQSLFCLCPEFQVYTSGAFHLIP